MAPSISVLRRVLPCIAMGTAMSLSGCATILHGTTQEVEIRSAPHGANVTVDGRQLGTTPLKTKLKRGQPHVVQVEKQGYLAETVMTTTKMNAAPALNVIIGGGAGIIIDLASGAATDVTPGAVNVDLVQEVRPPSAIQPASYEAEAGRAQL